MMDEWTRASVHPSATPSPEGITCPLIYDQFQSDITVNVTGNTIIRRNFTMWNSCNYRSSSFRFSRCFFLSSRCRDGGGKIHRGDRRGKLIDRWKHAWPAQDQWHSDSAFGQVNICFALLNGRLRSVPCAPPLSLVTMTSVLSAIF